MLKALAGAPISIDITPAAMVRDNFEFGINYRIDESYTIFNTMGMINNSLGIGYAFENLTSRIQRYGGSSSHELVLKLSI